MNLNRYMFKIHRVVSWLLVPLMAAVIITGYSYTRNLQVLNRGRAYDLHIQLELPLILLLIVHVVLALRIELMRFHIKGKTVDIFLLILGIVLGLSAFYVDGRVPR
ncbi:MAG: hypothetical protein HXS41_14015 [Theionarchaea archaeon]|nr:hypothetical protein [Theionarchaea archaeon]MBU7000977.1 hypothetical protein [Theionarchaea archaeon]MBU7022166.1 hypothetical protein [Theionarchaea archaeon]MBU7035999.1 hypothetical protein [Theionarchaea archaeon]MBU7041736.1 hypothetical protein [Theionarchaea archaeon]